MSVMLVSKVDIDALVTIALRWSNSVDSLRLSQAVHHAMHVSAQTADVVGARLLEANWNAFHYGGDPTRLDREARECFELQGIETFPGYAFDELPGAPLPETCLYLLSFYEYQAATDNWQGSFPEKFTSALRACAALQLGELRAEELPGYSNVPWGLAEQDRDLFQRLSI